MMLRKRSRTVQKERQNLGAHLMEDSSPATPDSELAGGGGGGGRKARNSPFFSVPGLFIGFNSSKCASDCDSARSPTSPLDYKVFSGLVRSSPSPGNDSPRRSWDCTNRVGLGLLDSLLDEHNLTDQTNKNVIFGSKMKINIPIPKSGLLDRTLKSSSSSSPKSLPKNYVISSKTQIEEANVCSCRKTPKSNSEEFSSEKPQFDLGQILGCSLSASDIENSEDYTRIISRGPNPRTTHIFCNCVLESHGDDFSGLHNENDQKKVEENPQKDEDESSFWSVNCSDDLPSPPGTSFLSFCHFCKKKLVEGEDIYIYRGEKAFCSYICREQEILIDEESDKHESTSTTSNSSSGD